MTGPSATTGDVNNTALEEKAIEQDAQGLTEGDKELANGEQIGDRVGDDPVAGVEQTRNGIGELLSEAATPLPVHVSPATGAITTGGDHETTHLAIPVAHIGRIQELLNHLEGAVLEGSRWVLDELRTHLHAG